MMPFRKNSSKDLLSGCAETGPQDGQDPRYDRPDGPAKVPNRKALLLCGQVQQTLSEVLAGCADDVLRDLLVESVAPFPTSVRLLVILRKPKEVAAEIVGARLEAARGLFRCEVATAVHRRKTPDLVFRVVDG
jgi:ribosome-binding factor A